MTLALEGIKVLDFSRNMPGPYCTMILGDLGADVLKIEEAGPPTGRRAEMGREATGSLLVDAVTQAYSPFGALFRNKRSIALNLRTQEARGIFYKLAEKADVVVEEFRPGTTKRLGVDYDTLKKINPRIIHCAITGYGQDGPYQNLPGHDPNFTSMGGVLALIGERGGPPRVLVNVIGNMAAGGMQAAIGILAALMAREKTGKGQFVDIAVTDGVISLLTYDLSFYFSSGKVLKRGEALTTGGMPFSNVYETKDKKYITVCGVEPWNWANLCRALGTEDLIPYQYDEEKREEIFSRFREIYRTRTRDEWFDYLREKDACVAKVYTFDELSSDPQIIHRQMIVDVEQPGKGRVKQAGISVKLSETPGSIRRLAPTLGEHTDEVLLDLGYDKQRIKELRKAGAIK